MDQDDRQKSLEEFRMKTGGYGLPKDVARDFAEQAVRNALNKVRSAPQRRPAQIKKH